MFVQELVPTHVAAASRVWALFAAVGLVVLQRCLGVQRLAPCRKPQQIGGWWCRLGLAVAAVRWRHLEWSILLAIFWLATLPVLRFLPPSCCRFLLAKEPERTLAARCRLPEDLALVATLEAFRFPADFSPRKDE